MSTLYTAVARLVYLGLSPSLHTFHRRVRRRVLALKVLQVIVDI